MNSPASSRIHLASTSFLMPSALVVFEEDELVAGNANGRTPSWCSGRPVLVDAALMSPRQARSFRSRTSRRRCARISVDLPGSGAIPIGDQFGDGLALEISANHLAVGGIGALIAASIRP